MADVRDGVVRQIPTWWGVILSVVTLIGALAVGASTQADQGTRLTKVEGQVSATSERLARIEGQTQRLERIEDKLDGLIAEKR